MFRASHSKEAKLTGHVMIIISYRHCFSATSYARLAYSSIVPCPVILPGQILGKMSRGTTTASGDITLEKHKMKWDPKTMEIRTHSVEKTLEPLVLQVSLCRVFIYSLTLLGKIDPELNLWHARKKSFFSFVLP